MSEDNEALSCCASCGITELDDVKLVPCDGCDLVKYCGDDCRELHRPEHDEQCKKRAAELRDELLFKQPESTHLGDCPICSLPMPIDRSKSGMYMCCSKFICDGCNQANQMREFRMRLRSSCPFCRKSLPETQEERDKLNVKRVEANDPFAIYQEGDKQCDSGDYRSAFEYFTEAAELGDLESHSKLSGLYIAGLGVEKDKGKAIHHLEEAAIGGHPGARYILGILEWETGRKERAVKHWTIAARQGEDHAIKELLKIFKQGHLEKEKLANALRAHKAAVDATKSPQRDNAEIVKTILRREAAEKE